MMVQLTNSLALTLTAWCCLVESLALTATAAEATPRAPVSATTDAKTRAFVAAIESCSRDCQMQIGECLNQAPAARALWAAEKYCDLLNYKENGTNSYDCLVKTTYCTEAEYKTLERASCGAEFVVVGLLPIVVGFITFLFKTNL